jgi:enoyl-CoA hydratase/carnithine racemase
MPTVLTERRGAVAILRLNNPEELNAITWEMAREINRAFDDTLACDGVRAILLTGVGRGFCAGAQLSGDLFQGGAKVGDEMRATISPLIAKMRASPVPIVVAVNGPAAGAGVGVALAGDIVFAARSARFVLSFAKLGAVLDGGTSLFLQRAIGVARARALALTGEPLAAATAADWGLIYKCVDDEALFDEAMLMAERLAAGPPLALAAIKGQLESAWTAPLEAALEEEAALQSQAFATDDLKEGAAAFREKRAPRFVGR